MSSTNSQDRKCADCGEPIGEKRLQARPNTKLCVDCQESQESQGRFTRHKIETTQEIAGWEFQGQVDTLIRGDD